MTQSEFDAIMEDVDRKVVAVKNALDKPETRNAYLHCLTKPRRFFRIHTIDEAVALLIAEYPE